MIVQICLTNSILLVTSIISFDPECIPYFKIKDNEERFFYLFPLLSWFAFIAELIDIFGEWML
jgi:hypothetical protein